jgi:hypothetical protein
MTTVKEAVLEAENRKLRYKLRYYESMYPISESSILDYYPEERESTINEHPEVMKIATVTMKDDLPKDAIHVLMKTVTFEPYIQYSYYISKLELFTHFDAVNVLGELHKKAIKSLANFITKEEM